MKALWRPAQAGGTLLYHGLPLIITATYIGILSVIASFLAIAVAMALSDNDMVVVAATASVTAGATAVVGVLAAGRGRPPRD